MAKADETATASVAAQHGAENRKLLAKALRAGAAIGAAALVASFLARAEPARADWLVLESGEQVETRGPWRVEGRRIIFTSTRGVLSSVRSSSVDVEASRELTQQKAEEAAKVEETVEGEEDREPVLVLTDEDIRPARVRPPAAGATAEEEGEADQAAAAPVVVPSSDPLENRAARQLPGSPSIRVLDWSVRPTGENETSILGYVQNSGQLVATAVSLTVTLRDSEGAVIATSPAQLSSSALMPGTQAFYEATFADGMNFAAVEFEASSVDLEVAEQQAQGPEGAEPGTLEEEAPLSEGP